MIRINTVIEALIEFDRVFKRPQIDKLPERLTYFPIKSEPPNNWASHWAPGGVLRTHADAPCVYFFFDELEALQYIGKADVLGHGMCQHHEEKGGRWRHVAKWMAVLPIPQESWFEIAAIEAYLIKKLSPPRNIIGVLKTSKQAAQI